MAGRGKIEEMDLTDGINIWFLKLTGFWNAVNYYRETGKKSTPYKCWVFLTLLVFIPLTLSSLVGSYFAPRNIEGISLIILNPMSGVQMALKMMIIWYGMETQCQLMEILTTNFLTCVPPDKKEIVKGMLRKGAIKANFWASIGVIMNYSTVAFWNFLPVLRSEFFRKTLGITLFEATKSDKPNKIFDTWYPVNYAESPWYEVTYVFEFYACFWASWMISLLEALIAYVVILLTTNMEILSYLIGDIKASGVESFDTQGPETEALLTYIKEHQRLLKINNDVCDLYNPLISMQISTGMVILIIGILNFFLGNDDGDIWNMLKFIMFTCYTLVEVIVYCYSGCHMESVSEEICFAAYSTEWYSMGLHFRKPLQMTMARSFRSVSLKAGKIYPVNLETLTNILQMSYSTSMLLYKMMND